MLHAPDQPSLLVERRILLCVAWWLLLLSAWGFGGVAQHLRPFSHHAPMIQIHAIGFALWTALTVVQIHMAHAGRRRVHAMLGIVALSVVCVAVVTGIMTVDRAMALERRTPGEGLLLLGPLLLGTLFVVAGALRRRSDRARHGRRMLLATTLFTTLAVDRVGFLLGLHAAPPLVALLRLAPVAAIASLEFRRDGHLSYSVISTGAVLLSLDVASLVGVG